MAFRAVSETDAGWHLALGRLIASGDFPRRNALSWTHPDEPWYPTSWLFDVTGYALASIPGLGEAGGLQVLTFLFFGLTLAGAALAAHQIARGDGALLLPLLSLMLWPRETPRPHVATWAVIAFVLALCLRGQRERLERLERLERIGRGGEDGSPATARSASTSPPASTRWRLWCLPLIALGSNFHSGAAFASIVLGLFCLEAFLLEGRRFRELVVGGAAVAMLAANPGGLFNLAYLIDHLSVQSVVRLVEFETPTLAKHGPVLGLVLVAGGLCFLGFPDGLRHWRRRPALLAAIVVFVVLGLRTERLVYKAAIVSFPALALAIPLLRSRNRPVITWGLPVLALLALVWFRLPMLDGVPFGKRMDERRLPVRAADFVEANGIDGRVFNAFRDGGYLAWRLPDRPVFQDGRVQAYPPAFFHAEQEAERRPERFREWLREWDVEWAVTTRIPERLGGFRALNAPDWALVYWDDTSEVWLRRDVERFGPLIAHHEYRHLRPYGPVLRPIAAGTRSDLREWLAELERFERSSPADPMALLVRCAVETRLDAPSALASCERAGAHVPDQRTARLLVQARELAVAAE